MNKTIPMSLSLALSVSAFAVPTLSNVKFSQADAGKPVVITYTLAGANAVVTVDIQTNAEDEVWASIGAKNISCLSGDVCCEVEPGDRTITWSPWKSWPGHTVAAGKARAVLRAWAMNATPDYMVVDLTGTAAHKVRYFTCEEALPGGLLGNDEYRKSMMVLRKIPAKNVTWTMGALNTVETPTYSSDFSHSVMLTNDYYIGVFPVTQMQWEFVNGSVRSKPSFYNDTVATNWMFRPVEQISYNELRNGDKSDSSGHDWPLPPNTSSFFGRLRAKADNKIDFDLPSDAQWEFAARAGIGMGFHGNGKTVGNQYVDENTPGRYRANGGMIYNGGDVSLGTSYADYLRTEKNLGNNATAAVGTYPPNNWGVYDMQGNVFEYCLDYFLKDITKKNGAVITLADVADANPVRRGGCFRSQASSCRLGARSSITANKLDYQNGFRVCCRAGLE